MALTFRKTISLGGGTKVNVSKRGVGISAKAGPVTVSSRGRVSVRLMPGLTFRVGGRRR